MNKRYKFRDWQKRIIFEDACYFVTSKTEGNHPYFSDPIFCDLFAENLRICKLLKGFYLYGWVLNYDHFHLLIQPSDKFSISDVIFSLKKQFSHDANRVIGLNELFLPLEAGKRLPAHGGNGLSTNIMSDCTDKIIHEHQKYVNQLSFEFKNKYPIGHPSHKFKWQDSFHDHYIRNESDFDSHMDYIAYNPDKHGLPDNWPYVFTNEKFENLIDDIL